MIRLKETLNPSKTVYGIAFEGERRGNLYVQFKDKDGQPGALGYYTDVPRALFNAIEADRKPGSLLNKMIKAHFEWVSLKPEPAAEPVAEVAPEVDQTLPDNLFIPFEVID